MWENTVESDGPQMTIWRMGIAFWITKATDTHSEYVLTHIAFPKATAVARTRLNLTLYVLHTAFLIKTETQRILGSIPGQYM